MRSLTITQTSSNKRRDTRRGWILPAFALLVAVPTFLASIPSHAWLLDMCAHLRLLLLYGSALLLLVALFRRGPIVSLVAATMCGINMLSVMQLAITEQPAAAITSSTHLRVLQSNIWARNNDYARLYAFIKDQRPDIVAFEEYTRSADSSLEAVGISSVYPYKATCPSYDGGSENALFSRIPLANIRYLQSSTQRDTTLIADCNVDTTPVTIAVLHPRSPMRETLYRRNCLQLQTLASHRNELGKNLIVLGDFNSTPYSWKIADFCRRTGLRDSRPSLNPAPSWPALTPFLPIDYVFVSSGIQVDHHSVGPNNGSDHLPVVCDISLRTPDR